MVYRDVAAELVGVSARAVGQAKRILEHDEEHGTDLATQVSERGLALKVAEQQVKAAKAAKKRAEQTPEQAAEAKRQYWIRDCVHSLSEIGFMWRWFESWQTHADREEVWEQLPEIVRETITRIERQLK